MGFTFQGRGQLLIDNIVALIRSQPRAIQVPQIGPFLKADPAWAMV